MLDPLTPEFEADRYAVYERLRLAAPVFKHDEWDLVLLSRHADVHSALRDRRLGRDIVAAIGSDAATGHREVPSEFPMWTHFVRRMAFMDREGAMHKRLRDSVAGAFTKKRVDGLATRIEAHTERLLDEAGNSFEAIGQYARPIPLAVIGSLLGVPEPDHHLLVAWSHDIVKLYDPTLGVAAGEAAEAATEQFVAYVRLLIAGRRRQPGDDLLSAIMDDLSEDELIGTAILVLNAGHEATVHAIGNAIDAVIEHPVARQQIVTGQVDWKLAVDELLRFDTPLHMFERWVTEPVTFGGVEIAPGKKVGLLMGAANHDPERFPNPGRLDLARSDNPHVSFGGGAHFCVGAALARVELTIALRALFTRHPNLAISGKQRHRSFIFRGFETLDVGSR